jgi:hypothetical protein
MRRNKMEIHHEVSEPWKVTLINTGEHTMAGSRLTRVAADVGDGASRGQRPAYRQAAFRQAMDTLRDRSLLGDLWSSSTAPWKTWT